MSFRAPRAIAAAFLLLFAGAAAAAEPPALAKARALYNAADYDGAINAAALVRAQPAGADAAALVTARSHLERYRLRGDAADLADAREALISVRASMLPPRDQVDHLVGIGQSLYLADTFGAAAEVFDTALGKGALLSHRDRLLLLDWWASALDREAQGRPPDRRLPAYERIASRMEEELRQDPGSAPANYWLAAASRGAGDLDRAWDAAMAGWIRATLTPDTADRLRSDVDRLVTQALVPERTRTKPARDPQLDWQQFKQQWP
ncbi:MAG: hypothetical protein EXQ59_03815 [Acidobacteria bacterium]|nr:hypothetical protein [Acidobacteriota bacterium]